jgi:DNA-binding beta-propeller fold protein YncE
VVPSWDLKTLWVTNNAEKRLDGTLTPIDPATGKPGKPIDVDNPYNMYFTPDGRSAVVVAEARKRLDFRDPQTMAMQSSISVPGCAGINHGDFSIDGRYAIFTCEFEKGTLAKIDWRSRSRLFKLTEARHAAGRPSHRTVFYVADMHSGGVFWSTASVLPSRSSRPALARTGSTPAATRRSSTSRTADRTWCIRRPAPRAVFR